MRNVLMRSFADNGKLIMSFCFESQNKIVYLRTDKIAWFYN